MNNLEPIRNALAGEPLLALGAGDATLACDASQLVFADDLGVQRLELREIRKVTHTDGQLVVTSSDHSIRGAFHVNSSELKAFFADVQTLRKQRDAGLNGLLESRFKPASPSPISSPLDGPVVPPDHQPLGSAFDQPISPPVAQPATSAATEIPGFSFGLAADSTTQIPVKAAPAAMPAASPTPRAEPSVSAAIPSAPVEDLLQFQPRPPKRNPRADPRVVREELPPPKPNPRAAVAPIEPQRVQPPLARPPAQSLEPVAPEPPKPERNTPSVLQPVVPAVASTVPSERAQSQPLERGSLPTRTAPPQTVPLSQPRVAAPQKPRAVEKPRLRAPVLPSVKLDLSALQRGLERRVKTTLQAADLQFNLRRTAASAIDAVLTLALMWGATRWIGGRELETLLRLPIDTRADLSMLESLKDLLPLVIAGALSGVLVALAAGLLYVLATSFSGLRATVGHFLLGLRLALIGGARAGLAVIAGRYLVNVMLLLVPSVLGLLPTLVAMGGPAINLRSSLQLFGYANIAGLIVWLVGQLPLYGPHRSQTLADYLTDCVVLNAPKDKLLEA